MKNIVWIIIIIVVLGGIFLLTSNKPADQNPESDNSAITKSGEQDKLTPDEMMEEIERQEIDPTLAEFMGIYEDYSPEKLALANSGKVVLFFHAPWCPTCRSLNKNISKNLSSIPPNIAILKTDYDNETALKQKYGVTYQHTLVQVDADGNIIAKWSGSPTLGAVLGAIK